MELPFEVPELRKGKQVNKKETNKKATKQKEYYSLPVYKKAVDLVRQLQNSTQKAPSRSLDLDQDIKVTQSQLNSYLGYLSYFRSNKVLDNTINQMNLLNLFELAKTKVKIKNYDENFNVGLGTPNIRAL